MANVAVPRTGAELAALPDDGFDRWLVRGELRERPFGYHEGPHSAAVTRIAVALANWLDAQQQPRGQVHCGGVGVQLPGDPVTALGLDVVYTSATALSLMPNDSPILEGVPTLAVEVLASNDKQGDINEKIDALLAAGVPLVWIVDPRRRTVTVHRPDAKSALYPDDQELTAEPHLSGFRVAVAALFE